MRGRMEIGLWGKESKGRGHVYLCVYVSHTKAKGRASPSRSRSWPCWWEAEENSCLRERGAQQQAAHRFGCI